MVGAWTRARPVGSWELLWERSFDGYSGGTPTVTGEHVLTATGLDSPHILHCLDAETGEERWTKEASNTYANSVPVADDLALFPGGRWTPSTCRAARSSGATSAKTRISGTPPSSMGRSSSPTEATTNSSRSNRREGADRAQSLAVMLSKSMASTWPALRSAPLTVTNTGWACRTYRVDGPDPGVPWGEWTRDKQDVPGQ